MALIDRKVSDWSQSVSSLDDKPQMTAADLKAAFDSNSNQLKPAINGIIDDLTGSQGASNIGLTSIDNINGKTVQTVLNSLAVFAKSTDDDLKKLSTSEGSSIIGNKIIDGISGNTVQSVLESLATLAKSNKLNLEKISSAEGAGVVGVSPISGISGETVQAMLQSLYTQMMEIDTGDPNPAQYIKKTEKGANDGVAPLNQNKKIDKQYISSDDFVSTDTKGQPNGVMPLNSNGKADAKYLPQMDFYTKAETLANNTKTLFGLDVGAVPDAVFNKIKTFIDSANSNANGKAKIQTGSYIGTGTGGDSNPTVINLNFTPKFIVIAGSYSKESSYIYTDFSTDNDFGIWFEGVNSHKVSNYPEYANFNVSGNIVKITGSYSSYQFNGTGQKYVYFAIG